uniref:Cadherin domain-containing protein n=1 Tax=Anopheles arabiensis TaxID=7173 RepID=A0A182HXX6_ANOAR
MFAIRNTTGANIHQRDTYCAACAANSSIKRDPTYPTYTTVLINVRDVNDNPLAFEKSLYRTQITEEDDRGLPCTA